MRRWDRLLDSYIEEYRARGVSPQSVAYTEARLHRWGRWLKGRRPRIEIERIDAEMITRYIASCSSFRAKATVYATLSSMRGFGDYLVRQGLWKINPLRWMKGPKVSPYSRLGNGSIMRTWKRCGAKRRTATVHTLRIYG
jgi:site-specific recombinase XerD